MSSTRERIVAAALELIAEQGLSAVTMVHVARTAGVAGATLYNHYPDVPSIIADAATHHNEEAIAGLRQALAVAGSPRQVLEHLVRHVAAISSHGHTLDTPHGLPPVLRSQLSAFDDELESQLSRALANGMTRAEFRADLDLPTATRLVRSVLNEVSKLVAASPESAPGVVEEAIRMILAAVTNPPS